MSLPLFNEKMETSCGVNAIVIHTTGNFARSACDEGETLEEAFFRELKEELGLTDPHQVLQIKKKREKTSRYIFTYAISKYFDKQVTLLYWAGTTLEPFPQLYGNRPRSRHQIEGPTRDLFILLGWR